MQSDCTAKSVSLNRETVNEQLKVHCVISFSAGSENVRLNTASFPDHIR